MKFHLHVLALAPCLAVFAVKCKSRDVNAYFQNFISELKTLLREGLLLRLFRIYRNVPLSHLLDGVPAKALIED